MNDELDAVMQVMEAAFDPVYGEAWNRKQVSDALTMPGTHLLLADETGDEPQDAERICAFALTRGVLTEEELLLIAVTPAMRGKGIARSLLRRLKDETRQRGVERLFLEMRDGNPAESLYTGAGFVRIGRRKGYYRRSSLGPIDAITFSMVL